MQLLPIYIPTCVYSKRIYLGKEALKSDLNFVSKSVTDPNCLNVISLSGSVGMGDLKFEEENYQFELCQEISIIFTYTVNILWAMLLNDFHP